MTHAEVQNTAKQAPLALCNAVRPGMTERQLVKIAADGLAAQGIQRHWYHGIPALLFAGKRTLLSQAAADYAPTDYAVRENDIITVDMSPEESGLWGDYARTIILQNGQVAETTADIQDPVFREGVEAEDKLHAFLVQTARPDMTFSQLHSLIDGYLHDLGYHNLDFLNNFGHSIVDGFDSGAFEELVNDPRTFFDANNHTTLAQTGLFTFEPHIARPGGAYGFKREDIYRFENGRLQAV